MNTAAIVNDFVSLYTIILYDGEIMAYSVYSSSLLHAL
jgi:hypothetical protein